MTCLPHFALARNGGHTRPSHRREFQRSDVYRRPPSATGGNWSSEVFIVQTYDPSASRAEDSPSAQKVMRSRLGFTNPVHLAEKRATRSVGSRSAGGLGTRTRRRLPVKVDRGILPRLSGLVLTAACNSPHLRNLQRVSAPFWGPENRGAADQDGAWRIPFPGPSASARPPVYYWVNEEWAVRTKPQAPRSLHRWLSSRFVGGLGCGTQEVSYCDPPTQNDARRARASQLL
jgi:hypothetical protein